MLSNESQVDLPDNNGRIRVWKSYGARVMPNVVTTAVRFGGESRMVWIDVIHNAGLIT